MAFSCLFLLYSGALLVLLRASLVQGSTCLYYYGSTLLETTCSGYCCSSGTASSYTDACCAYTYSVWWIIFPIFGFIGLIIGAFLIFRFCFPQHWMRFRARQIRGGPGSTVMISRQTYPSAPYPQPYQQPYSHPYNNQRYPQPYSQPYGQPIPAISNPAYNRPPPPAPTYQDFSTFPATNVIQMPTQADPVLPTEPVQRLYDWETGAI